MRVAVVASAQIFGGFQNLPPPQSLDFSAFFGLSHLFPPRLSISVIFDTDLVTSQYKPQVELIASPRVKGAYLKFYSFIDNYYKEYHKFCIENDPREDKNNYHTVVLEDGEEMEEVSFWSEDIKYFEKSAESFKH